MPQEAGGNSVGRKGGNGGQRWRLLLPLERECMGRNRPCTPVPSSNLGSASAGTSREPHLPGRQLLAGRAALYQGNLPAFLGQPGEPGHHLTSLSSSYLPGPSRVTPGCNLAVAPGFLPGVGGHQSGTSVGFHEGPASRGSPLGLLVQGLQRPLREPISARGGNTRIAS